jgi:hypothetical protein
MGRQRVLTHGAGNPHPYEDEGEGHPVGRGSHAQSAKQPGPYILALEARMHLMTSALHLEITGLHVT